MLKAFNRKSLLGLAVVSMAAGVPFGAATAQEVSTVKCAEAEWASLLFDGANMKAVEITEELGALLEGQVPVMVEEASKVSEDFTLSARFVYKDVVSGAAYAAIQGYSQDPAKLNENEIRSLKPTIGCYMPMPRGPSTNPSP